MAICDFSELGDNDWRTCANVYLYFFLTGDIELIAKLEEEIKHEKASGIEDAREQQASIDYTLQNGEWQAKDVEGEQEVVLTKKFGNETYGPSIMSSTIRH